MVSKTLEREISVTIAPVVDDGIAQVVHESGGRLVDHEEAEVVIWTNPYDPPGLKDLLLASPAKWVQMPMAGLERFFSAGVIDESRIWTCAKGIYGYACAEHALALMLSAARRIYSHARDESWKTTPPGSKHRLLRGATVMIVGTGGIGRALVELLQKFDVRIIGVNRSGDLLAGAEVTANSGELLGLLSTADFVVVAAALTPETRHLFDVKAFEQMKQDAWLVNVARGGLVKTDDLIEALDHEKIGGAALDVTDPEPLPDGHPLWNHPRAIVTPHVANTIDMSLPELRELIRRNIKNYREDEELEGLVDPKLGY